MKAEYYVEAILLSRKNQQVQFVFKRVPTKEQLEKWQAEKKKEKQEGHGFSIGPIRTFIFSPSYLDDELELNFNQVNVTVTLDEARESGIIIGDFVHLEIPEVIDDLNKLES